jgi:iron complex transport system substrate-binding protein
MAVLSLPVHAPYRARVVPFAIAITMLIGGCSLAPGTPSSQGVPTLQPPTGSPPQTTPATPAPSFPLTLQDDEGTAVTIPTEPQRIVSLTPAVTEIIFAMGAGQRVVATSNADDYPPEAVPLPDAGAFGKVDIEKIVGLDADLVIAGGSGFTPAESIERLRTLRIPVVVVYPATVDGVIANVRLIGRAVGRSQEADALAGRMTADFAAVASATAALPKPRVFYEIDASTALYGPADRSFLADMVARAGGDPITTGSPLEFEMPLERLVQLDPEVIVLGDAAYGTTVEQVVKRPGWRGMTAVRNRAIRPVNDILVTRPGPRLTEGLRLLAKAIHPDMMLP